MGRKKQEKERKIFVISQENSGNTSMIWSCACDVARVNFPFISCHKCGERAPSHSVVEAGGKVW